MNKREGGSQGKEKEWKGYILKYMFVEQFIIKKKAEGCVSEKGAALAKGFT